MTVRCGTVIELLRVARISRTLTNSPGHSRSSAFSKVPLSFSVPVLASIWFSISVTLPWASSVLSSLP